MTYTVDYFIKKFEAIPEEKWCTGTYGDEYDGKHCAFGHCKICDAHDESLEGTTLDNIFKRGEILHTLQVVAINDGDDPNYQQPTPKQRILAALQDIKKAQSIAYADTVINNIEQEIQINQFIKKTTA